jgi:ribose transport system permease protein
MRSRLIAAAAERPWAFAAALAIFLLVANEIAQPAFASPSQIAPTLATLAPFALAGMACTPAFLSGGGGIDLSVAPLMGLTNIVLVTKLLGHPAGSPWLAIPILLAIGCAVGAFNGVMIAYLRFPPVITTLGTFFVLSGVDLYLVPNPVTLNGAWTDRLGGAFGPIPGAVLTIGGPLLLWLILRRTAFVESLLAVGDHDATAFSAGVNVSLVRASAYVVDGLIAAVGGIALTALVRSADAQVFSNYVLVALAAAALGGTNLAGGRGSLIGPLLGAAAIFMLQTLLTAVHGSAYFIEFAYGCALFIAVLLGSRIFSARAAA